jgi:hypothetical protein
MTSESLHEDGSGLFEYLKNAFTTIAQGYLLLYPEEHTMSIVDLPAEILILIMELVSLSDCASFALSSRHFAAILGSSWQTLDAVKNKRHKSSFLYNLDRYNPSWYLLSGVSAISPLVEAYQASLE